MVKCCVKTFLFNKVIVSALTDCCKSKSHLLLLSPSKLGFYCCAFLSFLNCLFYFRHAGVYTAEEVALIMREKLIRLQSLYIDQFKRLQHLLKEKKRRYLHNRKVEHEALGKFYASSNKLLWVQHVNLVVVRLLSCYLDWRRICF